MDCAVCGVIQFKYRLCKAVGGVTSIFSAELHIESILNVNVDSERVKKYSPKDIIKNI